MYIIVSCASFKVRFPICRQSTPEVNAVITAPIAIYVYRNVCVSARNAIINGIHCHKIRLDRNIGAQHDELPMGTKPGPKRERSIVNLAWTQIRISLLQDKRIGGVLHVRHLFKVR